MIRVVVVEDEPLGRQRLRRLLSDDPELLLVGELSDGTSASFEIDRLQPDLLLLDVELPGADGLELLRSLERQPPAVIFVTAHGQHAIQAFDVAAVDFLLKPVDRERFERAVERAKKRLAIRHESPDERPLVLRSGGRAVLVRRRSVVWIEARGNYVLVHSENGKHLHRESLARMLAALAPARFVRIHRSAVVNLEHVAHFSRRDHGDVDVHLEGGTRLVLSRRYRDEVERALGHPL